MFPRDFPEALIPANALVFPQPGDLLESIARQTVVAGNDMAIITASIPISAAIIGFNEANGR